METLSIDNFKCFKKFGATLNRLTVLTGANGSGKSSVVQAVLLLSEVMKTASGNPGEYIVPLNGYHSLSLGSFYDICHYGEETAELCIDDNVRVILRHSDDDGDMEEEEPKTAAARLTIADEKSVPAWLQAPLLYLNAERLGPRWESDVNKKITDNAGDHGEFSGNMLLEASYSYPKVAPDRKVTPESADNFNIQTDLWMSHICSDVSFKSKPLTQEKCQVWLRQGAGTTSPPNTGFGFTYALPIVLDGLMAPAGSMMIVENPEAHLHPRAQSNMGYFLGRMAAAGVRIIVETHSEHIVNGMRRAALSRLGLSPDDLTIYFFHEPIPGNAGEAPVKITVDREGNLSDFPVDFFDQVRQDMLEIIRLGAIAGES